MFQSEPSRHKLVDHVLGEIVTCLVLHMFQNGIVVKIKSFLFISRFNHVKFVQDPGIMVHSRSELFFSGQVGVSNAFNSLTQVGRVW